MTELAPESADAGRLYLQVEADARGLRTDLQEKVDAAAARVRVRVSNVQFGVRDTRRNLQTAVDQAAARVRARVRTVTFDVRRTRAELNKTLREAAVGARQPTVAVRVRGDTSQLRRDLAAAGRGTSVNVSADTTRMRTETDAARREQEARPVRLRVTGDTSPLARALSSFGGGLTSLSTFPAIASGIAVAAGAAVNLAGALFSVASAGAQAAGVLAAVPGLIGAAVQGAGALVIGFSGIGAAVKALGKAETAGAATAGKAASSRVNSYQQIQDARLQLADAQQQAAERVVDARRQAAQRIADAEQQAAQQVAAAEDTLQKAQRDEVRAQQELTRARIQAREELQQLAFTAREAALAEEQAEISLEHARAKVLAARQSAVMSPLDRRQAELDYRQAVLDLEEAKDKATDLAQEEKKAQRAGVEGTDTVRNAEQQLADAKRATSAAEADLSAARRTGAAQVARAREESARQVAKAQEEGARQVAAAQRSLQSALRSSAASAGGTSAAMTQLGAAMDGLSPAGRRFAEFIAGRLLPRFKQLRNAVQEALLPPLQRGITRALPLLNTIQPRLARTGAILGTLAEQAGKAAGSRLFRADVATVMDRNNVAVQHFGKAGLYAADALRHVVVVASPLVVRLSRLAEAWAKTTDKAARSGRESGRMAAFFDRAWRAASKVVRIVRDVTIAVYNAGRAARPSGDTLLDRLADAADRLRKWTERPENMQRMQQFFENTVPLASEFGRLLTRVVDLLVRLGQISGGHSLDALFKVLNAAVTVLEAITKIPGGGGTLSVILMLSGAGLGLGLVAKALGGIVGNIGKLSRYTGVSKLFSLLTGRGGRRGRRGKTDVGQLADDLADTTTAIDNELPRDKKKSRALGDVGDKAKTAGKHSGDLAGELDNLGGKAEKSAGKSGRLARALGGLRRVAGRVLGPVGRLAGAITRIPGVGTALTKLGGLIRRAVGRIRLPRINLGRMLTGAGNLGRGAAGAARTSLGRFFGGIGKYITRQARDLRGVAGRALGRVWRAVTRVRLPGAAAALRPVGRWLGRIFGGLVKLLGRAAGGLVRNAPKLLGRVAKSALRGGGSKFLGGPWGIIGSILVGLLGDWIGGKLGGAISGGATGAGIGAFAGPIGAVVGGVIGALLGAFGKELKGLPGKIIRGLLTAGSFVGAGGGRLGVGIAKWLGRGVKGFGPAVGRLFSGEARRLGPAIGRTVGGAIRSGLGSAGKAVQTATRGIRTRFTTLRRGVTADVKGMFGGAATWARVHLRAAANWVTRHLSSIRSRFGSARTYVVGRAKSMVTGVVGYARNTLHNAVTWVGRHLSSIRRRVNDARAYVLDRWHRMVTGVADKTRSYIGTARRVFSDAISNMRAAVSRGISAITTTFGKLRDATRRPVSFFVNTVYDNGIRKVFELVRRLVPAIPDIPYMRFAGGGQIPENLLSRMRGLAGGLSGILRGFTPGRDIWEIPLAAFAGGEAVMRPEWTRMMGRRYIAGANRAARAGKAALARFLGVAGDPEGVTPGFRRRRRFAGGGVIDGQPPAGRVVARFADGGILGTIKSALKKPVDLFRAGGGLFAKGASAVAHRILDPILRNVASINTGGLWAKMVSALPPRLINGFLGFIKKIVDPALGGGATAVVRAARRWLGVPYSWGGGGIGGPGYGIGRGSSTFGFDCSGLTEEAWWTGAHIDIGGSTGPQAAGSRPVSRRPGALGFIGNPIHHVMLASDKPGMVIQAPHTGAYVEEVRRSSGDWRWPRAAKMDIGGPVRRGLNLIYNGTRRLEWLLSPEAVDLLGGEQAVAALNDNARRLYRASRGAPPARAATTGGGSARAATTAAVNVFPQPGQSEHEIGMVAARRLGLMLR